MSSVATTVESSSSAEKVVATTAMSLLTVVAIAGNLAVLVVVIRSPALRARLTNFFVINLCVVDSIAAIVVMPLMLAEHTAASSHLATLNATLLVLDPTGSNRHSLSCVVVRLLTAFVVFASVLSVAVANVERFMSIRYPMQHAAHLTVGRTVATIVGVWMTALAVAATPVVADWDVLDVGTRCCAEGSRPAPTAAAVFVVVVEALLFVVPTLIIAAMYGSIYRVARQAGRQVAPGVDDGVGNNSSARPLAVRLLHRPSSTVNAAVVGCSFANSSSMSCPALNHIRRSADVARLPTVTSEPSLSSEVMAQRLPATSRLSPIDSASECIIRISCREGGASSTDAAANSHDSITACHETSVQAPEAKQSEEIVSDKRWKAAVTLVFVVVTFLPLWSPFFAYILYCAVQRTEGQCGQSSSAQDLEVAVVWIAFATFASNAFVYGWMNRSIRDALREAVDAALGRCTLADRGRARLSQVLGAGDAEDFFQFLERTSSVGRAQSLTQSSTASVEITKVSQTRP